MIREIVHDPILLARPAAPAAAQDVSVADDLLDTLRANAERCVGMAANMIGANKAIIVFADAGKYQEMFNPVILAKEGKYEAEEGCLSLSGVRKAVRYRTIRVQWQNRSFQTRVKKFTGWTAQIIQHELDHCAGILI